MPLELAQGSLNVFVLLLIIWTLTVAGYPVPSELFRVNSQSGIPLAVNQAACHGAESLTWTTMISVGWSTRNRTTSVRNSS